MQRGGKTLTFEQMLATDGVLENFQVKCLAGRADLGRAKQVLEKFNFVGLTEKFDLSLHVLGKLCPVRLNLNYHRKVTAKDNTIKNALAADARIVDMTREKNQLDLALYDFPCGKFFQSSARRPDFRRRIKWRPLTAIPVNFIRGSCCTGSTTSCFSGKSANSTAAAANANRRPNKGTNREFTVQRHSSG